VMVAGFGHHPTFTKSHDSAWLKAR
jgi:hypothetical protein